MHNHQSDAICQETLDTIFGLIATKVSKIPTAKNPDIVFVASKEFLDSYLIHRSPRLKEMLWGKAL
jgi:hypothetical protein